MDFDFVWQVVATVAAAGAIYGGIRADLKAMHERVAMAAESAARAHERMDRHVETYHTRKTP
jgi:outer membrane murein-binding lipoprotein Lpp